MNSELPDKMMASLVITSLTNNPKFKNGLSDKFMEKHTFVDIVGDKGL